jgi:hypothetical protein
MKSLQMIYEMARPMSDATLAVLDWAASQEGAFTVKQMFQVYQNAGGRSPGAGFSSNIGRFKVLRGVERPTLMRPLVQLFPSKKGPGNESFFMWGLPGQKFPRPEKPSKSEGNRVMRALDRLETEMGRDKARAALKRWASETEPSRVMTDIEATVPGPYRADALLVAFDNLINKGVLDNNEMKLVTRKKDEFEKQKKTYGPEDDDELPSSFFDQVEEPVKTSKPQNVQQKHHQPKASVAKVFNEPKVQNVQDDEIDIDVDEWGADTAETDMDKIVKGNLDDDGSGDEDEDEDLGDGWTKVEIDADGNPIKPSQEDVEEDSSKKNFDVPDWMPSPSEYGNRAEASMHKIIDSGFDATDEVWSKIRRAKNRDDASRVISKSDIPPDLRKHALSVSKAIFLNDGREDDWDLDESRSSGYLSSIYSSSNKKSNKIYESYSIFRIFKR